MILCPLGSLSGGSRGLVRRTGFGRGGGAARAARWFCRFGVPSEPQVVKRLELMVPGVLERCDACVA